jgi:hypothetical protein
MDPTPATTVHAGPAVGRYRRRTGVGRALRFSSGAAAVAVTLLGTAPPGAAAVTGVSGDQLTRAASLLVGGAVVVGIIAGIVGFLLWRRRAATPDAAIVADIAPTDGDAVDPEQRLAEALTRGGRRPGATDAGALPAWVRRLDPEQALAAAPSEAGDPHDGWPNAGGDVLASSRYLDSV